MMTHCAIKPKQSPLRWLERKLLTVVGADRPLPIQLDITNACNLRCVHCYHPHHRNAGAMSLAQWSSVLQQYEMLIERLRFRPTVILCGGEPLLSPLLTPLMERIRVTFPTAPISILSNGTLVSQGRAESLAAWGNLRFQISLDGATATSHNAIRGPNAFERTRHGARVLIAAGIPVDLMTVLSERSAREIPLFFRLAHEWDAARMNFTRLITEGHAGAWVRSGADAPLLGLALREAYRTILEQSALTGVRTSTTHPLMHGLHPSLGSSGRFWEGIVVDYQGRLLASSRSRIVLGDVLKEGLEPLFLNHPLLKKIRAGQIEGCGPCPHYRRCGGDRNAAYAWSGNYLGMDPGCWIRTEASPETVTTRTGEKHAFA